MPRMLLCEGFEGAFFPEAVYVKQGNKAFFVQGGRSLCESQALSGLTIVESMDALELVERKNPDGTTSKTVKDGVWVVEGPFQRSDVKNANGRSYGRKIWERLIADEKSSPMQTLKARGMLGHMEHPKDGRTDGNEGAILVTNLKLRPDGVVWGEAEILDTPKGQILQEYTRKKVRWGVSSRGTGSVDDKGNVCPDDYMVETWDAVMRPSVPGAYMQPSNLKEGEKGDQQKGGKARTEASSSADAKQLSEDVEGLKADTVENLDESSLYERRSKLVDIMQRVNGLAKSEALSAKQALDLQDWLHAQLHGVFKREAKLAEERISQVIDEAAPDPKKADEAFRKVVASLQRRVAGVSEELQKLRRKLADSERALDEALQAKKLVEDALQASIEQANAAEQKLAIAESLIAEKSGREVLNPVRESAADAIRRIPGLAKHREKLEEAASVAEMETLVEELLPAVLRERPESERPAVVIRERPALPVGIQVVSESLPASRNSGFVNESAGAKTAGKALKAMGKV